ncbi:uncharacterized protein LOC143044534 isoform X1 [Mytilus galloprovincialis]|uniref:uncharacterized protein LOC143044534 isoform X1 n=1 Tax=Mytilus galloprovincialis TaxID=29158 RepID=UPI003F7BB55B
MLRIQSVTTYSICKNNLKMLIFGFVLFYLTSVTTLETDSDVKIRLFDNQNAPSTDIVKFLIHTFERKIKEIEKNLKHIQNIERKLTVHFTDYLNGIADKLVKYNAQQDNMIQSVDEIPDDRTPKDDFNEEKEKGIEFRPTDCGEMYSKRGNGIYTLFPNSSSSSGYSVYCDFETDNGNWTVFQRRINGTTDFFRGWEEYENGFGNLEAEFWLGNRKINELTSNGLHELRVDLTDFDGNSGYAKYSRFSVGDASTQYRLEVGGYSGNIGQSEAACTFPGGFINKTFDLFESAGPPFGTWTFNADGSTGNVLIFDVSCFQISEQFLVLRITPTQFLCFPIFYTAGQSNFTFIIQGEFEWKEFENVSSALNESQLCEVCGENGIEKLTILAIGMVIHRYNYQ